LEIGTTAMGTVLATITLNATAGTSTSGVLTFSGFPKSDTAADATGTAAAEVGADAFAAAGSVTIGSITGAFGASESGSDAYVGSGVVIVTGTQTSSETVDVFLSTGGVLVAGAASAIESIDTSQVFGGVLVSALFDAAETGDDLADFAGIVYTSQGVRLLAGITARRLQASTALRATPQMDKHDNNQNIRRSNSGGHPG
jgi:hypothetical protein